MLRQRIRCDAPSLLLADYDFIIQCCNNRPRSKVLNKLKEKYGISQKCIYQIWRGEEKNRVAWNQPILVFKKRKNFLSKPAHDLSQEGSEPVQKYNLEKNIIVPQI